VAYGQLLKATCSRYFIFFLIHNFKKVPMFKKLILLAGLSISILACNQYKVEIKDGVRFQLHKHDPKGKLPKEGDIMMCHIVMSNYKDSIIKNTYTDGTKDPIYVRIQRSEFKGGLEDGLRMLTIGDSATFFVSTDSLFAGGRPRPEGMPAGSDLKFVVKVVAMPTQDELRKIQVEQQKKQMEAAGRQMGDELKEIDGYLAAKKVANVKKSESGLRYSIENPGVGKTAPGKTAVVKYVGKLLNGTVFDQNAQGVDFQLGANAVIPGFEEGLLLLGKGGKAKIFIPSPLGYGPQGTGPIPPNSPLIFEVEIVDIK
jgi:FKBP-type peptidyl-prolyl cis-trans isomerase FkpA